MVPVGLIIFFVLGLMLLSRLCGHALLCMAAEHGSVRGTKLLLFLGSDANAEDPEGGYTALIVAAATGHSEVVQVLLRAGADVTKKENSGKTALHYALSSIANGTVDVAEVLVSAGALESVPDPFDYIESSITSVGHIETLIKHGVDPNLRDEYGATPIMEFSYWGDLPAVKALADLGADWDAIANDGRSALSVAVKNGFPDVVEYLLSRGAHLDREQSKSLLEMVREVRVGRNEYAQTRYDRVVQILQQHDYTSSRADGERQSE